MKCMQAVRLAASQPMLYHSWLPLPSYAGCSRNATITASSVQGFIQQRQPVGTCFLPRPLLRLMAGALWGEKRAATVFQLNLCAVRTQSFMQTRAADLAQSILDAGAGRQQGSGDFAATAAQPVEHAAAWCSGPSRCLMLSPA